MPDFVARLSRYCALAGLCLGMTVAVAAPPKVDMTGSKAASAEACVEPEDVMERNHMEFLKHQRDDTVHEGVRTKKYSLAECVDCHVSRDAAGAAIPINAEGQFCQTCHAYASVKLDCFECHATVPRTKTAHHHSLNGHNVLRADTAPDRGDIARVAGDLPAGTPVEIGR